MNVCPNKGLKLIVGEQISCLLFATRVNSDPHGRAVDDYPHDEYCRPRPRALITFDVLLLEEVTSSHSVLNYLNFKTR